MIKQIRLVGCQSWEDSTMELSADRINVIVGLNNAGKSVLFKMLKISVYPKAYTAKKRKKLIRWGHACAQALYGFDNGDVGGVVVYPTKVIYLYKSADANGWNKSYEPDVRLVKGLGLLANKDGSFIANIIDTDQNLLLVDSDSAATYEFIDMLCNNATLDEYSRKLEEICKDGRRSKIRLENKLYEAEKQLKQASYVDIDRMEHGVELITTAKNNMYQCIGMAYAMERLSGSLLYVRDYTKLQRVLGVLERLEQIYLRSVRERECLSLSLAACEILQVLERVQLKKVAERNRPKGDEFLCVLEKMEVLQLSGIAEKKHPPDIQLVNALSALESVYGGVIALKRNRSQIKVSANTVNLLEKEFVESGTEYACSIYGKVIFDGKECISYSV